MRRTWVRGAAVAGLVLLVSGGHAQAQDDGLDQNTLDALRGEVPVADGEADNDDDAEARFDRLVEIVGGGTAVPTDSSSSLEGVCGGYAYSFDENGTLIDSAIALGDGSPPIDTFDGGQAFTSNNPFQVDTSGTVEYFGFMPRSGDGPMDHTWVIETSGVSLDSGGDPNANGNNRNAGVVDLGDDLPVTFSAKVQVSGQLDSANIGSCAGEGYVEFIGNGLTDPVGIAGLVLLGGGLIGLLFNARPARTWKGAA